jgi:hypothetical protein
MIYFKDHHSKQLVAKILHLILLVNN